MSNSNNRQMHGKKICFFTGSVSGKGGTERVATIIANGLFARGYNVQVLSLWSGFEPTYSLAPGIKKHELFKENVKFKWKYIQVIRKLRCFLKREHIDVLVSVDVYLTFYSSPACIGTKIMHISWEHFNYYADLGLWSRRISRLLAAKTADAIVVLTDQDSMFWKQNLNCKARIVVISNPIMYKPIQPQERTWSNKLAISIGRLNRQKGFDLLINSWKLVCEKLPEWKLLIIGEGEEETELKQLIIKKKLEKVIEIMPFNNEVSRYYLQAGIYCLSSRFEGLPMVLLEAQAFGLPAVCFNCKTGPADIIEEDVNGLLIPENDETAFANGIIKLATDEELRKKLGVNALCKATLYEEDAILQKWQALLED